MNGSERALWRAIKPKLEPYGRLVRIESPDTGSGIADVYYRLLGVAGWLELKFEPRFPARGGPVRLRTLTDDQVTWLEAERKQLNGNAWILAEIAGRTIVPNPSDWRSLVGVATGVPVDELLERAVVLAKEPGKFPTGKVVKCLVGR